VLGVPDRFLEHRTTREEQLAEAGLDAESIERFVRNLLQPTLVA
jgi:deoxyxylulose-5-phosphate synthase